MLVVGTVRKAAFTAVVLRHERQWEVGAALWDHKRCILRTFQSLSTRTASLVIDPDQSDMSGYSICEAGYNLN
jgi:hypothetical protein